MSIISDYLSTISGPQHEVLKHMYTVVRQAVPDATETMSYNMPAFAKDDKAFIAIVSNKKFISVYPFCGLTRLGLDFSEYECTTGSIHFTVEQPIPDDLLRTIINARLAL